MTECGGKEARKVRSLIRRHRPFEEESQRGRWERLENQRETQSCRPGKDLDFDSESNEKVPDGPLSLPSLGRQRCALRHFFPDSLPPHGWD